MRYISHNPHKITCTDTKSEGFEIDGTVKKLRKFLINKITNEAEKETKTTFLSA